MAPRRRGLLKYLFLIPTLWFATIIIFALRTEPVSQSGSRPDLLVRVADRRNRSQSFVDRLIDALPFKQYLDQDHPAEERVKAREQARQMNAQVQVAAPGNDAEQNIAKKNGPGEMGNPVRINKDKLSPEERIKYDNGWKDNAFNQYASDMISLRRSLADGRDAE